MAAAPVLELDTASAVLEFARDRRAVADRAEADLLQAAVQWAVMHPTESILDAACVEGSEQEIPVAGPGAPLVAEFCLHEFAAAVSLPSEVGKSYVGEAVELRYRLPRTWKRVVAGQVQAWRARRVARSTITLSREAAEFVDSQVWHVADKIGPISLDRLVQTAIAQFMPDLAAEKAAQAAEKRHFDIWTHEAGLDGTVEVAGRLDLADALDLDAAVSQIATGLRECGSEQPLGVRRSQAVGELARRQLAFDFARPDSEPVGKQVQLHVHVRPGDPVADLEGLPVLVEQVKTWCDGGTVTIKPVVDLNEHLEHPGYEIPARIREQVTLRDPVCVFPHCRTRSTGLDVDHIVPWAAGGKTETENLAPLCRTHHRAKTHGRWRYRMTEPGVYEWTSPHGLTYTTEPGATGRHR